LIAKDHHLHYPFQNGIAQEQKSELIGYIVDNKMSIKATAKKANMSQSTGYKYYQQYLNA
jgi:transposase